MNIKIFKNDIQLDYKKFLFPAGEVGVRLDVGNFKFFDNPSQTVYILAQIQSSEDVLTLAMIKNALDEMHQTNICLGLPYLPYSRQDRVCSKGESFSLKAFGKLINSLNFTKVKTIDVHSNVAAGIFDRFEECTQLEIISKSPLNEILSKKDIRLVAPDAGSNKKVAALAKYFMHSDFIRADKLRDLMTGGIKETVVYADDLSGFNTVIIDDIIDGGKTFIELAKVLKKKNATKVTLVATHGIFSKGVKVLFDNGIDEIWTTNSYKTIYENDTRLKIINVSIL